MISPEAFTGKGQIRVERRKRWLPTREGWKVRRDNVYNGWDLLGLRGRRGFPVLVYRLRHILISPLSSRTLVYFNIVLVMEWSTAPLLFLVHLCPSLLQGCTLLPCICFRKFVVGMRQGSRWSRMRQVTKWSTGRSEREEEVARTKTWSESWEWDCADDEVGVGVGIAWVLHHFDAIVSIPQPQPNKKKHTHLHT